jgi:hypothetical protein
MPLTKEDGVSFLRNDFGFQRNESVFPLDSLLEIIKKTLEDGKKEE